MTGLNTLIVKLLPFFPKSFVWLFSRRYIAGKTLDDAVEKTKTLNASGYCTTIDVLGEDVTSLDDADAAKRECLKVLETIQAENLDANLSLKLTALGLKIDKERCYEMTREIVEKAGKLGNFVRIDMEDSSCTDDTLEIYRRLRPSNSSVGTVIQAYLKRSLNDVHGLIADGIAHLRLCKGIYDEPPEIAFSDKEEIRDNFMAMIREMLQSRAYVGIATHDRKIVERSFDLLVSMKADRSDYEFQMLLGVTEKLRSQILSQGHRMRVYVPYGRQWHGYCMRRLKENPRVAGHIMKNIFIRG